MLTDEQKAELTRAWSSRRLIAHVESLLAQARAEAFEEAAKVMDGKAKGWSDYKDSMPASATIEHNYVQGQINALTEATIEIRARKDAP